MILIQDSVRSVIDGEGGKSLTAPALSQISELELPFEVSNLLNEVNTALDNVESTVMAR